MTSIYLLSNPFIQLSEIPLFREILPIECHPLPPITHSNIHVLEASLSIYRFVHVINVFKCLPWNARAEVLNQLPKDCHLTINIGCDKCQILWWFIDAKVKISHLHLSINLSTNRSYSCDDLINISKWVGNIKPTKWWIRT